MSRIDISVCIPTYKRPSTLKQAIASFQSQNYKHAELVISDDSGDTSTEKEIRDILKKDPRISYTKNKKNIGFCKNLLKVILQAKGKYIFVLGDDDLILGKDTLKTYVDIFNKNSDVYYIYCNMLQFNDTMKLDYVYKNFKKTQKYSAGPASFENTWLKSTFITGIGLRNKKELLTYTPKYDMLFPQVALIGNILLQHGSYALAKYAVGMRGHTGQLGIQALKKKHIKGTERNAHVELYKIGDELSRKKNGEKYSQKLQHIINTFLYGADKSIAVVEGGKAGRKALVSTVLSSKKDEKRIKRSLQFWIMFWGTLFLPTKVFHLTKELYRIVARNSYWSKEVHYLHSESKRIFHI